MLGSNAGLRVESREHFPTGGPLKPLRPELDPLTIPQGSILLFEQQQASHPVAACAQPGRMQVHEGEQREGFRDRAHGVLRQKRRQPDGLLAQLAANRLPRVRGEIALVEQEVEHPVHAVTVARNGGVYWTCTIAGVIVEARLRR